MKSITQISPTVHHCGKTIRNKHHIPYTQSSESCNLFIYVVKGTGIHEVSGRRRVLSPATMEIIPPYMHQVIYTYSEEDLEIIYIYFDLFEPDIPISHKAKKRPLSLNELFFVDKCCYKIAIREPQRIQQLCEQLLYTPSSAIATDKLRTKQRMLELLILFLEENEISEPPSKQLPANHVFRAMQYIEMHYDDENLCAKSVAQYLGLNTDYLSRLFDHQVHNTLSSYIRELRIARAKELLYIDDSITSVAIKCGFSSVQSFCRTFKASEGISPGQYLGRMLGR